MTKLMLSVALALCAAGAAHAFDRQTTEALRLCHDRLWEADTGFDGLPNAAITVFPMMMDEDRTTVAWNVTWDDPDVRAAGACTVEGGAVTAFEDYTAGG
ncbi:hypothetical protein JQC91_13415 [Jannaschia sp. Os4]|uniref:hypothetical protein n=1 Tax=Jannaschia sp. Os4 TaxID=2807617 RepID=UPI00193A6E22|nr:hypothetical protein [Jannaschia sp. Os4]MBM2577302.1 hypothetical protein [Jannaschia sp. Os4]